MHNSKLVLCPLLVFFLSAATKPVFAQAAAEAGIVSSLSATTTTSAASHLSAATNRALQGQSNKLSATTTPHTATTTATHRTAASRSSTASTKTTHTAVTTTTDHQANLPPGIVHVWPPNALDQPTSAPQ